jgi:hypothetical protein
MERTAQRAIQKEEPKPLANPPGTPRRGLLDDDRRYLIMPVAKLLQGLSPEVKGNLAGAKPGVLWHNLMDEVLPEKFVPVKFYREVIKWIPYKDGGGMEWRSQDFTDKEVLDAIEWKKDKDGNQIPPKASETINCVALFEGQDSPIIVPFSGTTLKDGKKFYSIAKFRRGEIWDTCYKTQLFERHNDLGDWWALNVSPCGDSSSDMRQQADKLWSMLENIKIEAEHGEVTGESQESGVKVKSPGEESNLPPHLRRR